jgi:hypothetical protein
MKTAIVVVIYLAACTVAWNFQTDLRKRSAGSGLAIGYIPGSAMLVLPLDGSSTTRENLGNMGTDEKFPNPIRVV